MTDPELDHIFAGYRAAIPDPEPSAAFMPRLWETIEARRTFKARFARLSRVFVTAAGAIWLVLITMLIVQSSVTRARSAAEFDILADSHTTDTINLDLPAGVAAHRK